MAKQQPIRKAPQTAAATQAPKATAHVEHKTTNKWIFIAAVLLITLGVYSTSFSNAFVNWDDEVNLLENVNTEILSMDNVKKIFTEDVIGNYNPLSILTLAIERHFVGIENGARLYHIDNTLLHLGCVLFVFLILSALGLGHWAAAIGALLFGIHPMRVESVAWVTERKDVLFGFFFLWSLWLYIKSITTPEKASRYRLWIYPLFALALLSKIQAVALPLTMLCVDYYLSREFSFKLIIEKIGYFLMSAATGIYGVVSLAKNKSLEDVTDYNIFDRLCIGAYSWYVYLMKVVFPYEMSPLYPYPNALHSGFRIALFVGFPVFVALTYFLWKKGYKAIVFGIAFFFVNVVFMLQILGAGQGFLADRFTYIPYLGLFFVAAYYFDKILKSDNGLKTSIIGLAALYMVFCAWKSVDQIKVWKNGGALWSHVTTYYPATEMPWGNKGNYLRSNKMYKEALACYDKAIEIKPSKPTTYNSRGKTYFDMGEGDRIANINKALTDYSKGISLLEVSVDSLKKDYGEIYVNRGAALGLMSTITKDTSARKNQLLQAAKDIRQGVKLDAKNKNAYLNGYLVNSELARYDDALINVNKYIELSPNEGDMYYEKARILNAIGRSSEAIAPINDAIRLGDKRKEIMAIFYLERARAELRMGDKTAALKDAQQARSINAATVPDELLKQFQ